MPNRHEAWVQSKKNSTFLFGVTRFSTLLILKDHTQTLHTSGTKGRYHAKIFIISIVQGKKVTTVQGSSLHLACLQRLHPELSIHRFICLESVKALCNFNKMASGDHNNR